MKFKKILRILSGSRSVEQLFLAGVFSTSEFFMTFNYSYFVTPSSLIFCKSIFLDFILILILFVLLATIFVLGVRFWQFSAALRII